MDAPTHACAICRKPASSVCAGCVEGTDIASINHRPARYCGEDCQKADWPSHQQSCQAVQAKIKLFRAGQILQECFLATRAAASDVCASRVEREGDGTIHFYNQRADRVRPLLLDLAKPIEMRNAVLSYGASGEVFAGLMFELGKRAFRGYTVKVEEMDVRMFRSRISTYRHCNSSNEPSIPLYINFHSILRVTLKDMSTWAVDVAGAQLGQHNAIVPFAEYDRRFIAKNLGIRPYGTNAVDVDTPVLTGNARDTVVTMQLRELRSHQADELAEWKYHHVTVRKLLKAKHEEYQSLKTDLVEHLAAQSGECIKFGEGDRSSKAKPILIKFHGLESMTDEDRARRERKIARKTAGMDAEARMQWERRHEVPLSSVMF